MLLIEKFLSTTSIVTAATANTPSAGTIIGNVALFIALFATFLAIICYLPGAIRVMKTRDTRGLSLSMYWITGIGCITWIIVGILYLISSFLNIESWTVVHVLLAINAGVPVIISNLSLGTCCFILVWMKTRNIHQARAQNITEEQYVSELVKKVRNARLKKLKPKFDNLKNMNKVRRFFFKQFLMDEELVKIYEQNIAKINQ